MAATINTNTYSLLAQRNLAQNSNGLQSAINRLSSGLRVNSARDDASGLARGMSIDAASRVTSVQIRIAQDSISSDETKDGNLGVLNDVLQRMTELAADTANSTAYTAEMSALATRASALATAGGATITVTATDADHAAIHDPDRCYRTRDTGCEHERQPVRHSDPASAICEPARILRPHHGRRLRSGNLQHDPLPDSATSRYGDGFASQRDPAKRPDPVALIPHGTCLAI